MAYKKRGRSSSKKTILYALAALVILALTVFVLEKTDIIDLYRRETVSVNPGDDINYDPPTEHEQDVGDNIKEDLVNQENDEEDGNTTESDKRSVYPTITAWSQSSAESDLKINGFVPGIVETDGTCTVTMTRDDDTVTESRKAVNNAQSTACGQIVISKTKLKSGSWSAILSYESPTSIGASESVAIEVK